ncbi:MAG TPA: 16S rRNA (guanine(527)-N(7))-methyltransferase RsmG [Ruminococcaceae bacterium]|nr:16S rRNA (guanine(527)-N(7))-methyltransferase RsmG [Oscillospiraceae bacterium]
MSDFEYIIEAFGAAGIEIDAEKGKKLAELSEFMVEYNKNVNLTAITDFKEIVEKHFIDSILPFTSLKIAENSSFIDVGTGAGFPSLPLLIWRDDLKGTLCDSLQKRCVYLEKACDKLGIKAEIVHARAEELGRERREKYDFATARAVSAMPVLTEFCLPFVRKDGLFIALKSVNEDAKSAENAIKTLGGRLEEVRDYALPSGDKRRIMIVKKISQTPTKYPRSFANISKKPL